MAADKEEPVVFMEAEAIAELLARQQAVTRANVQAVDLAVDPAGVVAEASKKRAAAKSKPKRARGWFGIGRGRADSDADGGDDDDDDSTIPDAASPPELLLRSLPLSQRQALAGCVAWALRSSAGDAVEQGLPLAAWPLGPLAAKGAGAEERAWATEVLEQVVSQFLGLPRAAFIGLRPMVAGHGIGGPPTGDEAAAEAAASGDGEQVGCRFVIPLVAAPPHDATSADSPSRPPVEGWLRGLGAVPEQAAMRVARRAAAKSSSSSSH